MSKLTESAKGVYVIAPTPFDDGGAIDDGSIDTMVEFFLSAGADGLTIMGMMGEAEKLTQDESVAVMTRVMAAVAGRVPVIVGVSSPGLASLVGLSRTAMDLGAAGVMVAPTPLRRSTISPRIRGSPASLRNCLKSPVRSTQRNVLVCQASWTAKSERCIVTVVATMVAIVALLG